MNKLQQEQSVLGFYWISSENIMYGEQCVAGYIPRFFFPDVKLECSNTPMISYDELWTPEHPSLLKDPTISTYEDVVNLLNYSPRIAIPSTAVQL